MIGKTITLGQRLAAAREKAGLSILQAALRADTLPSTIEFIEEEEAVLVNDDCCIEVVKELAKIYHVSFKWLSTGESELSEIEYSDLKRSYQEAGIDKDDMEKCLLLLEMLQKRKGDQDEPS